MTLKPLTLRSSDGLRTLAIDLELDREAKVVTLHMLELDTELVCEFVAEELPWTYGVRIGEDASFDQELKTSPFELVIALAGRRHPARLVNRGEDGCSLLLGDPDAAYLERCQHAIDQVLEALHARGFVAVVQGIDEHGRPRPRENFIHLFALAHGERQEEEVIAATKMVSDAYQVDLIALGFRAEQIDFIARYDEHFAWSPEKSCVVRRNWGGDE